MNNYSYQQQSFFVNENHELLYNGKSYIEMEENISFLYQQFYINLQNGNLRDYDLDKIERFMRTIFNQENHFDDILYCSREIQIQAFNLFNWCFYQQLKRKQQEMIPEETFHYIEEVMRFAENDLCFTKNVVIKSVDSGAKGLIKSELYKYRAYQAFCKSK